MKLLGQRELPQVPAQGAQLDFGSPNTQGMKVPRALFTASITSAACLGLMCPCWGGQLQPYNPCLVHMAEKGRESCPKSSEPEGIFPS